MKNADIDELVALTSVLPEAPWGHSLEEAVDAIAQCLDRMQGPVNGRQASKYRACISQLRVKLEDKIDSAKKVKLERDAEVVLNALWNVESMHYRPSGGVHEDKVALGLCYRKYRVIWRLNQLSDAKDVPERAWDLLYQLIDTLHGDTSIILLPEPNPDTAKVTTIELVFGVVTLLCNCLAKAKRGGEILSLRGAIEGLRRWAIPLDAEKRNCLYSCLESQLAAALTGWVTPEECYLTEGDLAGLVTLHAKVCNRVTHNALRHVTAVTQRIPVKWLGKVGGHVLLNIGECGQPVVQKVLESFAWQIVKKSADQKCSTPAMAFMHSIKGVSLVVPQQSGFHVGAIEMISSLNAVHCNQDWGKALRKSALILKKLMDTKDWLKNQRGLGDLVQGLESLGIAAEFILQNSPEWLKELDRHGKGLMKTACDALRMIWQLMEIEAEQKVLNELLTNRRVRLLRALLASYRIEAQCSKDHLNKAFNLGQFRELSRFLTEGGDTTADIPNLGYRIIQLAKDLDDSNFHREAAHAFLGAGLVLSKSPKVNGDLSTSKNINYCCWHAKDKLVRYGGLDPGAELSFLGGIVVDLVQTSGCSPLVHGQLVGYHAELMVSCSNLVPVQTLVDQALNRPSWQGHLNEICQIAWMELDELSRIRPEHCAISLKSLTRAVALVKSNSGSSKHLVRVQILEAVASALKCRDVTESELRNVFHQIEKLARQNHGDSMEALGCGYLALALIYACHAYGNWELDSEVAALWWNQSSSMLRKGSDYFLKLLSSPDPPDELSDPVFASETLVQAAWLSDARGFLGLATEFRSILAKLIQSGRFGCLNDRVEKDLANIANSHWLGHTSDLYNINTLGKSGKLGSLNTILGDIQRSAAGHFGTDHWLDAYCSVEPKLEKYGDARGFQARIYLHIVAARIELNKGQCIKAFDHIMEGIKKSNGYHGQMFSQNEVAIGLTTVPWWVKGDLVSTFMVRAEILESMGRPKEALHWLDYALDVTTKVQALSYIALANLMKAGINIRLDKIDHARGDLEKAKLAVEAGKQGSNGEECIFEYLEVVQLKTEGDFRVQDGMNTRLNSEASGLYESALERLNRLAATGCLQWPIQALQLKTATSLADCLVNADQMDSALDAMSFSFSNLTPQENIKDYMGTATLVAIYHTCRLCRKGSESAFTCMDDLGHVFGLRSTRDRFWKFVLDSDDEMDVELASGGAHDWILAQAQKIVMAGRLPNALDWIEILVYCWNHFQEMPDRMRDVALDLSAEFAQGGQLHAAVFFLFWAMGSAFRLQCLTNVKRVQLNSDEMQRFLTPPTFSLHFGGITKSDLSMVEVQCRGYLEKMLAHLPAHTCSIAISQHPWTKNVLVGRYSIGRPPLLVMLPAVCQALDYPVESERLNLVSAVRRARKLLDDQRSLFDEDASETMLRSVQKKWWAARFQSENTLKKLIADVDKNCMGDWSWLLSGEVKSQQIQDVVAEVAKEFTEGFVRSIPGTTETTVLTESIRLALMAGDSMPLEGLIRGVEKLCEIVGCPDDSQVAAEVGRARKNIWQSQGSANDQCDAPICLTSVAEETCMQVPDEDPPPTARQRRQSRMSLMQVTRTPVRSANRATKLPMSAGRQAHTPKPIKPIPEGQDQAPVEMQTRMPSMLILDPSVQALPWENCPSLVNWTFYRAPSLVAACAVAMELNEQESGSNGEEGPMHCVDLQSTFYVLDPDGDLPTLSAFKDQFSEIPHWRGVTGSRPCWDELSRELEARDMYIYFGHGLGERFINSNELKKLSCRSAALIMGCNSGTLWDQGQYEPEGQILNFLLGGCPAVVGNLWMVGDASINQFSQGVLNSWKLENDGTTDSVCLASSLLTGRESCHLRYLTGAAPVCYGVPVRIKKFKDRDT